ncbi:glutamyl-tRNA synthetase [Owenweeksia hongkongensis DSM 17368]|uniref:Glutamate--tRNA ligase n=1 Tax=Owenweeksia hongkongensis (strain DSM 17368 / CIP 108786 / JCM 12287 / NRRL B-23963 / UST20020801) TaxID=926562 RepID=G8R691_OWEHD|nr:glutamate--tRNA ligase [Owenweeksia hongkongensis]AEV33311.1 glutamyl-tRNA synthetase [Owenweeksia hongkongensis DSM 17368]
MSERKVRVRFAPSPTGPLHMGGVRTALYNYLFAKKHGGDFILRIEDTDQTRYVPGAEDYIIQALTWSKIIPDEGQSVGGNYGPYRQSERKHLYRAYADQLIESGHAYYAFDTSEDLDKMRELAKQAGTANWQYNHVTRSHMKNSITLSAQEVQERLDAGEPYVIRIKLPRNEEVKFEDIIRGWVSVNTNNMDDKVLFKSDGMPTYHLANIVDDHLMEITHVIRGEEWLPSAPLHILLYRYLGWEETRPQFAHLPLLLKPDGNGKLSKRDGDRLGFPVFPLQWKDPETDNISSGYREQGYFSEAFINMLAFLGWNPGTEQELFTMQELIDAFTLERVNKAGAKFDHEKTKWFNQQYLRKHSDKELGELLLPYLDAKGIHTDAEYAGKVASIMKERAYFVTDILDEGMYFFEPPINYDEKTLAKKWNAESRMHVENLLHRFEALEYFDSETLEKNFKDYLTEKETGFGKVGPGFRLAVTGQGMGASMFDICAILGKQETVARMRTALEKLPA